MAQTSTTENLPEETKKNLFNSVMHQKWEEAAKIYEQYPSARTLKITSSGETALHLVISDPEHKKNKLKNVETLVGSDKDQIKELINLQTEKGNTPLHSAAATGHSGKVCQFLIESVRDVEKQNVLELVRVRCKKGETPLFKAVQYGRPGSFFYLNLVIREHYGIQFSNFETNDSQSILNDPIISSILVRNDGQSILHEAIIREHFALAFYIIKLYRGLVNLVGNQGYVWSTAAMLVTFCASRFLVFEEKIKHAAFPIYAVTFFPLCLLAVAQFQLYFDLVRAICFSPFRSDFSTFLKKQKKKVKEVLKPKRPEPTRS